MNPSPQRVRTRRAARPRNLAIGCLAVLVVLVALAVLGWAVRQGAPGPAPDPPAVPFEARR